ncbi:MAG: CotH kinase family protein [Bacteroidota bacterium]|nr:CotH kinase family protein [Bacteroidota bacterium]
MKNIRYQIRLLFVCCLFLETASISFISAQTFTSSNLPIVIISTNGQTIVNEPKITADMGIIDNGPGVRNNLTDPFNHYKGKIGIEIRGSSTQMFPKKQYGLETRDTLGESFDVSIFGFPEESDWILSASYNDKTLMRDALTYTLASSLGRYASRTRFCEVVINDQYQGVYIFFEKIKRDKNRVNISKMDSTGVTGDALTGGYIIKIDKLDGSGNDGWNSSFPPQFGSKFKILYQYHYPKPEDITADQKLYIKNFVLNFESILYSSAYADTVDGYSKYLDVPSMVDFFLISEATKNVDSYRLSSFMYKDKDSKNPKLFFGPVWDYNHGFGNCDYYDASTIEGWQLTYLTSNSSFLSSDMFQAPFWWKKVYEDTIFIKKASSRWKALRSNKFSLPRINKFIDSVSTLINEAQVRNFTKWPILNTYVWPNAYIGGTYPNEIIHLKKWIVERFEWMDIELTGELLDVQNENEQIPNEFTLSQNYPNPFNPNTVISYSIPQNLAGLKDLQGLPVTLKVFDILGKEVAVLVDRHQKFGTYSVSFDAHSLSAGMYFYRLQSGNFSSIKKMILIK